MLASSNFPFEGDLRKVPYPMVENDLGILQDVILKSLEEQKQGGDQAEKSYQAIHVILEDMSHQTKTPITRALLLLDLHDKNPSQGDRYRKQTHENLTYLYHLNDFILKLVALESGVTFM